MTQILVRSFTVKGGDPFDVEVPGNPPVVHDGRLSVWHLLCTSEQAGAIVSLVESTDGSVVLSEEVQSDEQRDERRALLGDDTSVFPTVKCPGCFWFDPQLESFCGYEDWPVSFKAAAGRTHQKAKDDIAACPKEQHG